MLLIPETLTVRILVQDPMSLLILVGGDLQPLQYFVRVGGTSESNFLSTGANSNTLSHPPGHKFGML